MKSKIIFLGLCLFSICANAFSNSEVKITCNNQIIETRPWESFFDYRSRPGIGYECTNEETGDEYWVVVNGKGFFLGGSNDRFEISCSGEEVAGTYSGFGGSLTLFVFNANAGSFQDPETEVSCSVKGASASLGLGGMINYEMAIIAK